VSALDARLCMCVCVCVCARVRVCGLWVCTQAYVCMQCREHINKRRHTCARVRGYVCVCLDARLCMSLRVCACSHTCIYVYARACMCLCTLVLLFDATRTLLLDY